MSRYAIGVDLGGTNLRVAAISQDGRLVEKLTLGTEVGRGRDAVLNEMCLSIGQLSRKLGGEHSLLGIGIGVPGIIDMDRGMLRESPNLPGWHDYPVQAEIHRRLGTQVVLENDANAAALGEAWLGAARGFDSACMITLGTGVGGGIVLDGKIWHGMTGMAGELGHLTVDADGPKCNCGNRGCLEQYASATAVVRMARETTGTAALASLAGTPALSSRTVYELAETGDQSARAIFEKVGWALGIALAGMVNVLNLPMYVIGGGVASSWDLFAPAMLEELQARSFVYKATKPGEPGLSGKVTLVTRAQLGSDAGLYGAARLGMGNAGIPAPSA
jgi:glucokinase